MKEKFVRNVLGIIGDCDLYTFEDWEEIEQLCADFGLQKNEAGAYIYDDLRIYCGVGKAIYAGNTQLFSHDDLWGVIE